MSDISNLFARDSLEQGYTTEELVTIIGWYREHAANFERVKKDRAVKRTRTAAKPQQIDLEDLISEAKP